MASIVCHEAIEGCRFSARYRLYSLVFSRAATARAGGPLAIIRRASSVCALSRLGLLPRWMPARAVAAIPALTRCLMVSRSNSASEAGRPSRDERAMAKTLLEVMRERAGT